MQKALTRLSLALLAATLCARTAWAQTSDWAAVSPAGEGFAALMPKQPAPAEAVRLRAGGLSVTGRRYDSAADPGTSFVVWSLRGSAGTADLIGQLGSPDEGISGVSPFMDRVAWLAWELLVTPEIGAPRGEAEAVRGARATRLGLGMVYVRDFELGGRPAREYQVNLKGGRGGPVYVCADGPRIYVVAGLGADATDPRPRWFADSFALGTVAAAVTPPPAPARRPRPTLENDPVVVRNDPAVVQSDPAVVEAKPRLNDGRPLATLHADPLLLKVEATEPSAPRDEGRTYEPAEVSVKAVIYFKPEPGFTRDARQFRVTGAVRLRAVLSATGAVKDVHVVKGLPHGLSEKAVAAARQIRFEPAQKDGRAVSQYVFIQYNFDVYRASGG